MRHRAAQSRIDITPIHFQSLGDAKRKLDLALITAQGSGLLTNSGDTMQSHVARFIEENSRSGSNAVYEIRAAMGTAPLTNTLLSGINTRLDQLQKGLKQSAAIPTGIAANARSLDDGFLGFCEPARSMRSYAFRFQVYTQAFQLRWSQPPNVENEIGNAWKVLEDLSVEPAPSATMRTHTPEGIGASCSPPAPTCWRRAGFTPPISFAIM